MPRAKSNDSTPPLPTSPVGNVSPMTEPAPIYNPQPLSPSDERTWAMVAHLSVLANLITGFLGPVAAIVIYLVYKDRSRYVAFHSLQSFIFQLIWWVGGGAVAAVAWTISGVLTTIVVGFCLMPIALLVSIAPLVALVYGVYGAFQINQGRDFKYWLVGDWVRGVLVSPNK